MFLIGSFKFARERVYVRRVWRVSEFFPRNVEVNTSGQFLIDFSDSKTIVGHLFQNYDTIYVRFFSHVNLQPFLLHDIRAFFCHVYLHSFLLCGVFIPKYKTIFL